MEKLRTLQLPSYRGVDFFATIFVEPAPQNDEAFDMPDDAEEWGLTIHFQPDEPYASHIEVARIDTGHGQPHFDRLYLPQQPKEWLGQDYTYEQARQDLFSNWQRYADQFLQNHYRSTE